MKKLVLTTLVSSVLFGYPNCAMCHNGGMGVKLDKFSVSEIKKDLLEFKTGKKYHSMMAFVKNMSDKEIEEVAKKYGKNN
jgi:cytochrome c553